MYEYHERPFPPASQHFIASRIAAYQALDWIRQLKPETPAKNGLGIGNHGINAIQDSAHQALRPIRQVTQETSRLDGTRQGRICLRAIQPVPDAHKEWFFRFKDVRQRFELYFEAVEGTNHEWSELEIWLYWKI